MIRLEPRSVAGVQTGFAMLAAALLGFTAPATYARQLAGNLGCDFVARDTFDATQKRQIQSYADSGLARLRDADPAVSVKARDELVDPLACAGVSVGFRIEYGQALEPELRRLVRGADLRLAANALLIMGKVKSTASISMLSDGLREPRPALRLAAASGIKSFLSPPSSGLPDRSVEQVLDALGAALAVETEPLAAESFIAALDATRASDTMRTRANSRLVDAMTTRLLALRGEDREGHWAAAIIRAVDVSRNALIQQLGVNTVDRDYARRAGVMSALALAYVRDRIPKAATSDTKDASATTTFNDTCQAIVTAAEGQIVFAHTPASGQAIRALDLGSAFKKALASDDASDFNKLLGAWIGPAGLFTKPPYNIPPADLAPRP